MFQVIPDEALALATDAEKAELESIRYREKDSARYEMLRIRLLGRHRSIGGLFKPSGGVRENGLPPNRLKRRKSNA